jgi:hypothetical protein
MGEMGEMGEMDDGRGSIPLGQTLLFLLLHTTKITKMGILAMQDVGGMMDAGGNAEGKLKYFALSFLYYNSKVR